MAEMIKKGPLRSLVLISDPKLAQKAKKLFEASHLPIYYQTRAEGTATSEMVDVLGLGNNTKIITFSIMPKVFAVKMLESLKTELHLKKKNTAIAFTVAITGINSPILKLVDDSARKELAKKMEMDAEKTINKDHASLIVAIVNHGFSEEVMDAAKEAGAGGGTVVHARRLGGEEVVNFWGIALQEEKEIVIILSKPETKLAIMKTVGMKCGMHSEAKGVVFSSPIDMVIGLEPDTEG